jgi:hypothetical protein
MSAKTSSDSNIMSTATASVTKTTKATKTPKATASAEPVVAAPVAAPAPAAAKVSKKAEKVAAAPVAAPAAPVAVATTETVAAPVAAVDEDIGVSLANAVSRQQELVAAAKTNAAEQAANLKTIEKLSARLAKKAERRGRKKTAAVEGAPAKDCIFTKPVRISDELGAFLGKPKNTEVSRSEVTKGIMAYAKAHSLMNKQTINADASLRKLLTLAEGDKLTILNLQKFLRRHYIKATPVAA